MTNVACTTSYATITGCNFLPTYQSGTTAKYSDVPATNSESRLINTTDFGGVDKIWTSAGSSARLTANWTNHTYISGTKYVEKHSGTDLFGGTSVPAHGL